MSQSPSMQKATGIIKADAFHLPFADATFDIVVADPPYEIPGSKAGRSKRGVSVAPYRGFRGRDWWNEARRVLKDDGRLYVFAAVRELGAWLKGRPRPRDILSWFAPNALSIGARHAKRNGTRIPVWRPILEWTGPRTKPLNRVDSMAVGNFVKHSLIGFPMAERLPWPNQVPVAVMRWLLAPLPGGMVLDLFAGTGSARIAAAQLGKTGISVEEVDEAIAINQDRPLTRQMDIALEAGP